MTTTSDSDQGVSDSDNNSDNGDADEDDNYSNCPLAVNYC